MDEKMPILSSRLCIFHRRVESTTHPCPLPQVSSSNASINPLELVTPYSAEDAVLLETLQNQPSCLCQRCAGYDIVNIFKEATILDRIQESALGKKGYREYLEHNKRYEMQLCLLSSLRLTPSCQLCRLIYRILPRGSLNPTDHTVRIVPFRSYVRRSGWEILPSNLKAESAIFLGIYAPDYMTPAAYSLIPGDANIRLSEMAGEAIALTSHQTFPGRKFFNARFVDRFMDFEHIKRAIELCKASHGKSCQVDWPAEMAMVRMVDVINRRTVPCPNRCDYVALSYVWGGVMPVEGALESETLPRTIEDAITATKRLGRRYLWVDALCIDQSEILTPEQAAAKQEQLNLMHLIYSCATITIVAIAGSNSNTGLAGVSSRFPRVSQIRENIHGYEFFTVPPTSTVELDTTVWLSRAWTLQEGFCARRMLYLSENQARFECKGFGVLESDDVGTEPPDVKLYHPSVSAFDEFVYGQKPRTGPGSSTPGRLRLFGGMLNGYTKRRMTNEQDSLNAFLGILAVMEEQLFPSGFVWGLPLFSHPQSLAWVHDRRCSPKRREAFPSWSWAGWEGDVILPEDIIERSSERRYINPKNDLTVQVIGVDGKDIIVDGWVVTLEIRTQPFSEAFKVGSEDVVGSVTERNFIHNNTLPSGTYSCLVIQMVTYQINKKSPEKQRVFLLLLDWEGQVARRKTLVTLTPFLGGDFMRAEPQRMTVRLR